MRFAPAGFPLQAYLADSGSAFSVFEISGVLPSILTSAHPKFFVSACDGKSFQAISYAHLEATCGVVEAEPDWPVNKILDPVSSAYSDSAYCASALLPDGTAVCLREAGAQIACARSNREWITSCKAAFPSHSTYWRCLLPVKYKPIGALTSMSGSTQFLNCATTPKTPSLE